MVWDRSKQNFWISRNSKPICVVDCKTNIAVVDIPAEYSHIIYDEALTEKICFAKDMVEVISLFKSVETGC